MKNARESAVIFRTEAKKTHLLIYYRLTDYDDTSCEEFKAGSCTVDKEDPDMRWKTDSSFPVTFEKKVLQILKCLYAA